MNGNSHTVLVVEHDYTLRRALESVISGLGYRVLTTGSPDTAYSLLNSERVDAVLLDSDLPTMSGPALYLAILHRWPHLSGRIGMVSDDPDAEHLRPWLAVNSCPVVRKPFRADRVAAWLKGALQEEEKKAVS